jgi:hypothetical protein
MSDDDDQWDFYPCQVDDEPASIFLNMRYEGGELPRAADTLYWFSMKMADGGDHGMGTAEEADVLFPIEDVVIGKAADLGLVYVGRLRHAGTWQIAFYGPAAQLDALKAIGKASGRSVEVRAKLDREWEYYREFLLPDDERRQWMQNRRLVAVLEQHGDPLDVARRVDHWVYFATAKARTAFVAKVKKQGFAVGQTSDDGKGDFPFGAQVHRDDSVELEHIHEVVMGLYELAEDSDGSYDGWETSVEKSA